MAPSDTSPHSPSDTTSTSSDSDAQGVKDNAPEVERAITINRPLQDVYDFWSQPEHFATAMSPLVTIEQTGSDTSHWSISGPANIAFEWKSRTILDPAARTISWQTLPGSDIPNEGQIRLSHAPGDRGTEARLRLRFDPPGGKVGEIVANRIDLGQRAIVMATLRRIKSLIECGEVPTLEKNPSARG